MAEVLEASGKEPEDSSAERALLGAILLDPDSLFRAQEDGLQPDDFARESHRLLFRAFQDLHTSGKAVDLVTVSGHLESQSKLDRVGGYSYLASLSGSVPSVVNFIDYVRTVREKAVLRRLLDTARAISQNIYSGEHTAAQSLELAEKAIYELGQSHQATAFYSLSGIIESVTEDLRERFENPSDVTGVTTGFKDLDVMLAGLQRSDLVILAARPSMGKTALALNMMANAALQGSASVAFFSLEMSKEQLATRLLSSDARVSGKRVRTGQLRQDDWPELYAASERLAEAKIHIDDTPSIPISEVRAKCRRLKAEHGLDMVMVDYLQLMRPDRQDVSKNASREQEISAISRGLKLVAKELNIPVVALSQLNRGVESRTDKRPLLSDLRESGAIEQDADVIMFLYRDEFYNEASEQKGMAEVLVKKQRSGPIGDVMLAWRSEFTRFENLARESWQSPASS
ncbi:MAG TPA: replicative DNA helicase [Deltaproteobacteria bacterium]|nr:replicative DNA helicase [Deltaproteobacteria bacterium]HCP44492.1 replicative DNA helicase [Deltaproteobacteria bacterium]